MRSVLLPLLCTFALAGCFEYASVPPASALPPATPVRVRLSRPMDFPVTDVTVRDVVELRGELAPSSRDSALSLSVFGLTSQTGYGVLANGETVSFPRSAVVQLDRRHLSAWRSGLVAALIIGGGTLVANASGLVKFSGGSNPGQSGGGQK